MHLQVRLRSQRVRRPYDASDAPGKFPADAALPEQRDLSALRSLNKLIKQVERLSRLNEHLSIDGNFIASASKQTRFNVACDLRIIAPFGAARLAYNFTIGMASAGIPLAVQPSQDGFESDDSVAQDFPGQIDEIERRRPLDMD
jgi:hypothetical protein